MVGAVRDAEQIIEMGFPVYSASVSPVTPAGRAAIVERDIPIYCGGARIEPGDIIVGDWDGVVSVPQELAVEVLEKSLAMEATDEQLRTRIREDAGATKLGDIFGEH